MTVYDAMVAPIEIRLEDANWGQGATPDYVGTVTSSVFTLVRQQFEQIWYMRFVDSANGTYSRRSKVVRIYYPVTPLQPTLISADSNFIQFDFNGDIRNVYGFELRQAVNVGGSYRPGPPIVQKPCESYGDLNIDLTQTVNTSPLSQNRVFFAYFFNHQWSYSEPTMVTLTAPVATVEEGYRFGQSLNVMCTLPTENAGGLIVQRGDLAQQIWQVAGSSGFASGDMVINQSTNYAGSLTVNVPATGDLWARTALFDFIGSGAWSPSASGLHIPLGDLLASDYLAAQGSTPPVITSVPASGGIISYISSTDVIEVDTLPFSVLFPNGQTASVSGQNDVFNVAKDTGSGLVAGAGYLFYFSMSSMAYPDVVVFVDGPYQNPSQSALAYTISDGRIALSGGQLTFYMSTTPSGTSTGGGGGSGGGGYCGVLSSMVLMNDGSQKQLRDVKIGDRVDDGYCGAETVVGREIVHGQRVRLLRTADHMTRVADIHTLKLEYGWESILNIEERIDGAGWPLVDTVDGMQQITSSHRYGLEDVCHLQLSGPRHTYVLDGFKTHNYLIKDGGDSTE